MSEQQKAELLKLAKGAWQREIIRDLIQYREIKNPIYFLKGRAKSYKGKYERSFINLLARLEKAGYQIACQRGPKGGYYSATYTLQI